MPSFRFLLCQVVPFVERFSGVLDAVIAPPVIIAMGVPNTPFYDGGREQKFQNGDISGFVDKFDIQKAVLLQKFRVRNGF